METTFAFITSHLPFIAVAATLWLIGHFMERSVFTKARVARHPRPGRGAEDTRSGAQKFHHWFFYWGRESMELHGPFTGLLIGLAWLNPENADPAWSRFWSASYFVLAGVVSLFGWKVAVMLLERFGVKVPPGGPSLPGED